MADAVVKLKVESQEFDNKLARATQQLQHMEKEVRRTGASFEFADKEELAFIQSLGQMETKTQSLRTKMREYTESILSLTEMYQRLSDAEKNSDFGRGLLSSIDQIKQRAGELKDNMGDLDAEIKHLASDTSTFDSLAGGVNLMVSAFQVGQGIIQMFGVENENAVKAIAKLQGAMAVTNGLVQLQNALQKESAVMLGVTTLQKKALAAAEALDTKAKTGNIIVTKAATVAQSALNLVAKANPYVLLATAIAAVGAALFVFSKRAKDVKTATDDLNEINAKANENAAKEITHIETLNNILHDNTRSLDERRTALKEIQSLVPDYHGALTDEGTLIDDNTTSLDNYITNLKRAATAQAAFDKMVELQKEKLNKQLELQKKQQNLASVKSIAQSQTSVVTGGAGSISGMSAAGMTNASNIAAAEKDVRETEKEIAGIDSRINHLAKYVDAGAIITTTTTTGGGKGKDDPIIPEGSAAKLKQELADLKKAWDIATTQKERDQLAADIDRITKKLEKMRGEVVETSDATDTDKVETAADMWKELSEKIAEAERLLGEFQAMAANTELSEEQRNWAADMVKKYEEEIKKLKNTKEVIPIQFSDKGINELKTKIKEALGGEIFGSDGYALQATKIVDVTTLENLLNTALTNGLNVDMTYLSGLFESIKLDADIDDSTWDALVAEINTQLKELKLPPIKLDVTTGNISNVTQDAKKSTDAWQQAANAVNNLGGALNNLEDPSAKVAGIIMQAVANIALGFAQAAASPATGAAGVFGWIAAATAGLATMTATISSIKSVTKGGFANGGIVPGNSFSGDNLHTSDYGINSGELILNRSQQNVIASQLQGGAAQNMRLEALVSGESLRMVLANNASRRGGNRAQYAISKFG